MNYIFLVGFLKGMADGFYHFPKNILDTEKIDNETRQRFDGLVSTVKIIIAITIPFLLGILLTYWSYTEVGKIFFLLFIIMFIISYWIKDEYYIKKKFEFKKLFDVAKKDSNIGLLMIIPLLSGLSYSSGVMGTIMTLVKINNFKTNLTLGYVDSVCAVLLLLISIMYTTKIKKKNFDFWIYISGWLSMIVLLLFVMRPSLVSLIAFLFVRNSFTKLMEMITSNVTSDLSNCDEIKKKLKPELFCSRDVAFSISRCFGYIILLFVCLKFGMDYINYILIIPAITLLAEGLIVGKLCKIYKE